MNRTTTLFAFMVFVGFLGILVYSVPRLDLGSLVGVTILFVAYDFFVAPHNRS